MNLSGLLRRVIRHAHTTDTPSVQADIESLADERHRDVEVLESYGYTASPPDAVREGLAAFVGGQSDHGLVLGWLDKTHRPRGLKFGEVCLYASHGQTLLLDDLGQVVATSKAGSTIKLLANGDVQVTPASGVMRLTGSLRATGDVVAGSVSLQDHVHRGVQVGPGLTQKPV